MFTLTGHHHLLQKLASAEALAAAFAHVCKKHKHYHHHADIWHVRRHWATVLPRLQRKLLTGTYFFSPIQQYWHSERQETVSLWCAEDAIVLKVMSTVLGEHLAQTLDLSAVKHVKGREGVKKVAIQVAETLTPKSLVFKTDIKRSYQSMDHALLIKQAKRHFKNKVIVHLIRQVCEHVTLYRGQYNERSDTGILRGSSLSPVLGTLYLSSIDSYAKQRHLNYVRYMDDLLFITPCKEKLAGIIQDVCGRVKALRLALSGKKTWVGHAAKGFVFWV